MYASFVHVVLSAPEFLNNYLREGEKDDDADMDGIEGADDDDDDDSNDDGTNSMLQSCLTSIVDTLSQHNPRWDTSYDSEIQ